MAETHRRASTNVLYRIMLDYILEEIALEEHLSE